MDFPILPSKTGMLFFDTLNIYLHPENPTSRAAVEASGVVPAMVRMYRACREAGVAIFYGLRRAGVDTLMIAGGATEVGVASTAYSARDHDLNLIILSDACRASKPGVDEFFMARVFPIFARVMTVDEAIAAFARPGDG